MVKLRGIRILLTCLTLLCGQQVFSQLSVVETHTNVSCFGGNDGVINVSISATGPLATSPWSVELQYRFFGGGFVTLAFYSGVSTTNYQFKTGNSSLNQPGADAFGIPANAPGDVYRVIVSSAGTGGFLQRNRSLDITITEPPQLSITINSLTPDCNPLFAPPSGNANGAINLTISGGTGSYNVTWPTTPPSTPITGSTQPNGATVVSSSLDGGSYTVNIVDANNCSIGQNISLPISTLPNAGGDFAVCTSMAVLSGNSPGPLETGTWTGPIGVTFSPNANTPNATASNLSLGVNTLTWTITTAGCAGNSDAVDITRNALPVVSAPIANLCIGSTETLSPTTGGTWMSSNPAFATVTNAGLVTAISAGSVTFTFMDAATTCSNTTSSVTVNPNNTITLSSAVGTDVQTVCVNTAITNITYNTTGATGATFSGLPTGVTGNWVANVVTISGTPTTAVGSPFNYTVTLTGGCGSITANGTITVNANNTIALSSAAGTNAQTVCVGTAITNITYSTTGATGATFSGLPTGVNGVWAGNVVTISGTPTTAVGSPFNYTVTLTGGCTGGTNTAPGTIAVKPSPTTSVISGTTPVCAGSVGVSYSVTNTAGSTYAWTITGGVQSGGNTNPNITVDWGVTSGPANIKVVETNSAGCAGAPVNLAVTINALPTATLTGTSTICAGSGTSLTVNFTGNAPWLFKYSDGTTTSANINSNFSTFTIPVNPGTTTTYSLVSVSDANCTGIIAGSSAIVTVDNPPNATLAVSAAVSPLCNGGSTTIDVANSEVGVSYQLRNGITVVGSVVNGTGSTINLTTGVLAVTTTFNVLATRGVCTPVQLNNTATVTVAGTINSGLTVTVQTNPVCSGSATNIQIAASEVGVNYQLRDASNSTIGSIVSGTGVSINLPTGNLIATQTFNVLASNGTCSVQLTTTPTVNVDINPNPALTVTSSINPLCTGGSTTITVAASEVGVSYQLRDATNALVGSAVVGSGGTINLPTGNLAATTTFNVLATGGAACSSVQLSTTVTVTVSGSINATLAVTPQSSPICSGSSTNIQVAASEVGVNYQLRDNSTNALIGGVINGTGATINLPTGSLVSTTTFNILASNGTCSVQLNSLATVTINVNPNSSLATAASINPVCSGGSSSITVSNSEIGVSYQLRDASNANIGSAVAGTSATINLPTGVLASNTTFNVLATSGVCTSVQLTSTVSITVGGSLNTALTITPQSASICSGTATNIQIANSEVGVTYQLRNNSNNSLIGSTVNGTGATINLPTGNLAANTTFNILASNGTCSIMMSTLPSVTVNTQPNVALGVSAQSSAVCTGTGTNIQVANSELGVSYQLRNNSGNVLVGSSVNGNGATINLPTGNLVASTTFNIFATGGGSCSAQLTATATVNVLLATDPLCTGGGGTGTCATVVITPVPTAATCTLSNGAINFNINPATPAVNNTGVKITISGISTTNSTIARTNFNNPSFPALPIGVYNYVIEYGDPSCTKNGQVTIDQSGTVGTPVASNIVAPVCAGTSTGSLQLDVAGETGNLLQWSLDGITFTNFTAGNVITGIPAGAAPSFQRVISVRRNSSDPCFAAVTVTIQDANPAITTILTPTAASCANNDGSILVGTVSGGVTPYTYQLNGVSVVLPGNNTLKALSGGNYILSVIDSKGCQANFNTTVNFPGLVNHSTSISNPSCFSNGTDGAVVLTILSSGTFQVGITTDPVNPPTTIQNVVSSGSATVTFGALSNGGYYISMTPVGAACFTKSPKIDLIGGPSAVDFTLAASNILCFENKGGVSLTNIKGSNLVNYNYEIIDGNGNIILAATVAPVNPINQLQALGTVNLIGLGKGDYKVRLYQDQSVTTGCAVPITSAFKSFTIAGPVAPLDTLFTIRKISLPDLATGSMVIGIKESQKEPYDIQLELKTPYITGQTFILNPHGVPSRNPQSLKMEYEAKNLFAGLYDLKITDALGCQKTFTNIEIKVDTDIFIPNVFTPNGDKTNDNFYVRNLPDGTQVIISNRWGAEVFTSSNYKNDWTGGNNPDGIYFYRISVSGKVFTGWVEIIRGQ